jgi:hypothetical protein
LFVTIFAYFLYFHFSINLGVGIYVLWVVNHTADVDISVACHKAIKDPGAQNDCAKLLNSFRGVADGLIAFILVIELCMLKISYLYPCRSLLWFTDGMLIVTRYMRQLKKDKKAASFERDNFPLQTHYYSSLAGDDREDAPIETAYHPRHLSYSSATHFPTMPHLTVSGSDPLKQNYDEA